MTDEYSASLCEEMVQLSVVRLLSHDEQAQPFYAHILLNFVRHYTNDPSECPSAGVWVKGGEVHLIVNYEWFCPLPIEQQTAILTHEILHIVVKTQSRQGDRNPYLWNIASDTAINQYISDLPDSACRPEKFKFPYGLASEEYYEMLLDTLPNPPCGTGEHTGPGSPEDGTIGDDGEPIPTTTDDHGHMKNSGDTNADFVERTIADIVERSLKSAEAIGNVPYGVARLIEEAQKPQINWRMVTQRFITRAKQSVRLTTHKRPNRRYRYLYPGYKRKRKLCALIGVDTSGSITNKQLSQFDAEVNKFVEGDVTAIIAECDAQIHRIYEYSKKIDAEFHGGGGTDFRPVFELVSEKKVDADCIIYLTDSHGVFPDAPPKIPVLWVLTGNAMKEVPFGDRVELDV